MALTACALAPFAVLAQYRHPAYLHARSDLRRATLLIRIPDEPNVNRDMLAAADFTERAIRELDTAARWDHKDIDEHPPIDTRLGRGGRSADSAPAESARHDVELEKRTTRSPANGVIVRSATSTTLWRWFEKGGYDKLRDEIGAPRLPLSIALFPCFFPPCPICTPFPTCAMLAPYCSVPIGGPVMRDQRAAVDEIDHAIGEARRAAIDDGKNPDDHPPHPDRGLGWEGRFRQAMELLNSAERDLSEAETNGAAAGWRNAALANVRNAKGSVAKAMRDSWWR